MAASLASAFALTLPAAGHAVSRTVALHYERAYAAVVHVMGHRAPGRNIVRDGLSRGRLTDARVKASIVTLHQMLAPPPPPPAAVPAYSAASAPSTSYTPTTYGSQAPVAQSASSGGAGGVPACASESGTNYSTGPSNTNASSGATGRYQILPSTSAAYGCDMSTPAGQDACASKIYHAAGASQWVGCGG